MRGSWVRRGKVRWVAMIVAFIPNPEIYLFKESFKLKKQLIQFVDSKLERKKKKAYKVSTPLFLGCAVIDRPDSKWTTLLQLGALPLNVGIYLVHG